MILAGQNEITLNLQDFDKKNIDHPYYRGVTLHEFGHALGFEHVERYRRLADFYTRQGMGSDAAFARSQARFDRVYGSG